MSNLILDFIHERNVKMMVLLKQYLPQVLSSVVFEYNLEDLDLLLQQVLLPNEFQILRFHFRNKQIFILPKIDNAFVGFTIRWELITFAILEKYVNHFAKKLQPCLQQQIIREILNYLQLCFTQ